MDAWCEAGAPWNGLQRVVVYHEGDRALAVHFELTGFFAPFNWVTDTGALAVWSSEPREAIAEAHQVEIRARLVDWCAKHKMTIGFVRGVTIQEYEARMRRMGYEAEPLPGGGVKWSPKHGSVLSRLFHLFMGE